MSSWLVRVSVTLWPALAATPAVTCCQAPVLVQVFGRIEAVAPLTLSRRVAVAQS